MTTHSGHSAVPTTIAQVIAQTIVERDTTTFGLVGNGNIHMISELIRRGGNYVGMRHEAGTVAAADAYYRATGNIAVASTTYGPGFTNSLTSLSEALAARIPLVYVAGTEPYVGGRFQRRPIDVDTHELLVALGVPDFLALPMNIGATLKEAFAIAEKRSIPVVLSVPHNLVDAPVELEFHNYPRTELNEWIGAVGAPTPNASQATGGQSLMGNAVSETTAGIARAVVKRLRQSSRPLILAGRGVVESGTEAEVARLGEHVGALFATTAMARGAVPEQWSLGISGGFAHQGRLSAFRSADTVLVLGAGLNALQSRKGTIFSPDAQIIRIDHDLDSEYARTPFISVTDQVELELADFMPAVMQALEEEGTAGQGLAASDTEGKEYPRTWREDIGQIPVAETEELDPGCFAEMGADGRLDPRHVLRRLNELLPRERSIVTDGGHFLGWVPKYMECPDARSTVLVGGAVMTIGLGLSSATGVAAARPERFTALLTGDGGLQMASADMGPFLDTVRDSEAGGALVVLNDAAYGAEIHQYAVKGLDERPMLLNEVDFASAGQPYGVPGLTVTSPEQLVDGGEVEQFLADNAGSACILDVKISRVPVADFLKE